MRLLFVLILAISCLAQAPAPPKQPKIAKPRSNKSKPTEAARLSPEPVNTSLQSVPAENKPIKVSDLPPVSISRDWMDRAAWAFSAVLVVVGCFGVRAAYKTLRAIERQANLIEEQARLMKRQADVMERQAVILQESVAVAKSTADLARENIELIISKERARIRVEVSDFKFTADKNVIKLNAVEYSIICDGLTPAFITNSWANAEIHDSSSARPTSEVAIGVPRVFHPSIHGTKEMTLVLCGEKKLEERIRNRELFLHFYGCIEYTDFCERKRYTRFRYLWHVEPSFFESNLVYGEWVKCGLEDDNKAT